MTFAFGVGSKLGVCHLLNYVTPSYGLLESLACFVCIPELSKFKYSVMGSFFYIPLQRSEDS